MTPIDEANGCGGQAGPKDPRDLGDSFEVQLRICAGNRREKIFRHEKISDKGIGDALRRHPVLRPPFIDPANERLPSMMLPMTDFVGELKSLPYRGGMVVNSDDRCVVASDDPRHSPRAYGT